MLVSTRRLVEHGDSNCQERELTDSYRIRSCLCKMDTTGRVGEGLAHREGHVVDGRDI
jgi:hypothetical protein